MNYNRKSANGTQVLNAQKSIFTLLLTAIILLGTCATKVAAQGSLTGSVVAENFTKINLTEVGTTDWVNYYSTVNRKATGGSKISNLTLLSTDILRYYTNDARPLSWTDGTPTATATSNTNGVYTKGVGNGFSLTVPAGKATSIVTVYVHGYAGTGIITAHLSDNSAPDYTNSALTNTTGVFTGNYTFVFNAASGGQTLTITWKLASGATGNIGLSGAALSIPPDTDAPTVPANLSSTLISPKAFTLNWDASTDNEAVKEYDVYKDGVLYGSTATTSLEIKGLKSETEYSMTVKAKDNAGNISAFSSPLKVTTSAEDPNLNLQPYCGNITTKLYTGRGQQVLILPNVSDGDDNKTQNLTLTAVSKDETKMTIDSVVYKPNDKVAFIYVKSTFVAGDAGIDITLKDDGGVLNGGIDTYQSTQTVNIIAYVNPCANFVQYDVQHWQSRPSQNTLPTENSYQKICSTKTPIETLSRDMFWMRMNGYIIPSKTEYYIFQGYSNEGFYFYLNLNDGLSTDATKLTTMVENATSTWISSSTLLEANKAYYFECYARDIVSTQPFWLKWTSASIPTAAFIENSNLAPDYDIEKPSTPLNLRISNLGSNDITLKWDASTDNDKRGIKGYNIFVDGVQANDTLIKDLQFMIKNLNKSSVYSCVVTAVDASYNASIPTKVLNVTTYNVDAIPPPTPTGLAADFITAFGVKLHWNAVVDAETQTRGYNVYKDNILVKQNWTETSFLVGGLEQLSNYTFSVSAVDAGYNESAQTPALAIKTIAFDPNETRDEVHKGRLTVNLKPLCKYNGIGVNVGFNRTGFLGSNAVSYSGFESLQLDTLTNLKWFGKGVSNASFKRSNVNPYSGTYSAQISALTNGYFRCTMNMQIDKQYTYMVRFAMRRGVGYTGDVKVGIKGSFAGTFPTQTITPADDNWHVYDLTFNTTYSGVEGTWYLDFTASAPGDIFLDNIQFVNKSIYKEGSPYSTKAIELLKELKIASLRFGGIPANSELFKYSSGVKSEKTFSYAEWLSLANEVNAKAFFCTGVSPANDFITTPAATFKTFTEYMVGDASTTGGAIRASEGFGDLISKSKGVIFEFGNETWGNLALHKSVFGSDYTTYGKYCRDAAAIMRSTPGYNADKIRLSYSGRYPGQNYGLHKSMLTGATNEVDYLSISGYLGGNIKLDPEIPLETSQLDYYKAGFAMMERNFGGLTSDLKEMLAITGRILPMYMYEGNMTSSAYNGRLGQAIAFADYYTAVPLLGVPNVCVWNLEQGEWRMIDNDINFKKLPLFHVAKYINTYCTGNLLETKFVTSTKIYNEVGTALTLEPVGCRAYTDTTSYSVAMFSRDFEHDYMIQLDIPDTVGNGATCKVITLTGNTFNDQDVIINEQNITNFKDSMLVKVPKYSLVIVRFDGIDQHFNAPEIYTPIKPATSIKISTVNNVRSITTNRGRLNLTATILPTDAFLQTATWKLLDNETIGAYTIDGNTTTTLYGNGLATGNGYIRVVAYVNDGSGVADTVKVLINKQAGVDIFSGIEDLNMGGVQMYPVPAKDYLKVLLQEEITGTISIVTINGSVLSTEAIQNKEITLDVRNLNKGVYLVKINANTGPKFLKFVKQ